MNNTTIKKEEILSIAGKLTSSGNVNGAKYEEKCIHCGKDE